MFGRLAMGFASVRAGTRVQQGLARMCPRAPSSRGGPRHLREGRARDLGEGPGHVVRQTRPQRMPPRGAVLRTSPPTQAGAIDPPMTGGGGSVRAGGRRGRTRLAPAHIVHAARARKVLTVPAAKKETNNSSRYVWSFPNNSGNWFHSTQHSTAGLLNARLHGPGTRPNISESHSETSTRVPFCIERGLLRLSLSFFVAVCATGPSPA